MYVHYLKSYPDNQGGQLWKRVFVRVPFSTQLFVLSSTCSQAQPRVAPIGGALVRIIYSLNLHADVCGVIRRNEHKERKYRLKIIAQTILKSEHEAKDSSYHSIAVIQTSTKTAPIWSKRTYFGCPKIVWLEKVICSFCRIVLMLE